MAYDPAYDQRQSSHNLRWPYQGELSRFQPTSGLLKIVLSKPVLSVMVFLLHVGRLPLPISRIVYRNRIMCEAAFTDSDSVLVP